MCNRTIDSCGRCSLQALCQRGTDSPRLGITRGQLPAGRTLYFAGEKPDAIYALRSGSVKEVMTRRSGAESVVHVAVPGEAVGLAGLSGTNVQTSAVAVTAARYCRIPLTSVEQLARDVPRVGNELLRLLASKVASTHELVACVLDQDAIARVAGFVLDISARLHRAGIDGSRFRLGVSRQDIASYLGVTIETVSRSLTELGRRRLLDVHAKDLAVLHPIGLRTLAEASAC